MNLKNAAVAVALSLSLAPVAARADDGWSTPRTDWTQPNDRQDFWEGHGQGYDHDRNHRHDANCRVQHRGGRYQLQNVQRWVEGRYEQYWVAPQCQTVRKDHKHGRGWGHGRNRTVCTEGYYTSRFIPGHYETAQQWVWVPYSPRFGVHVSVPLGR